MTSRYLRSSGLSALFLAGFLSTQTWADTAIETETADLGTAGESNFSQSVQFEKEPDGKAVLTVTQYEYAITSRAEILIEPFLYEADFPKGGKMTQGVADLEITPSYMVILEGAWNPAVVTAFKVTVPTGTNGMGEGVFDYYPYLIIGKHIGKFDLNSNIGLQFFQQPKDGPHLDTQLIYDLAAQTHVTENLQVITEVFGNTKPSASEDGTFAGSAALEYTVAEHFNVFFAAGYDTNKLLVLRPGFNIPF